MDTSNEIPMTTLDAPLASLGEQSLSVRAFLRGLHRQGRLLPLARAVLLDELVAREAAAAGLAVADADLQQAANRLRRRFGLESAERTLAWLSRQGWSALDLEASVERDLLRERWKDHLAATDGERHFAAQRDGYDRLRLRQLVVGREDLARELLSQVRDEGRSFAEVAADQASAGGTKADEGGRVVHRRQLPADLAAALAGAAAGDVVGPVATPTGFVLVALDEVQPARLDGETAVLVRETLFQQWLGERFDEAAVTFPVLDELG